MSRIIDIYLIYQFIRRLVTPFDQMEAFKQGIIDKDGKFLKKRRDLRTSAEKNALGYFDVLIINLKKLLGQFPGGRTRLATYAAALYLIRENTNKEHSEEMLIEGLERYMKEAEPYLTEQAPTVSAGSGQIAGIGVGPDGEPGLTKAQQKKHRKRAANTGPIISDVMKRKKLEELFDRPEAFRKEQDTNDTLIFSAKIGDKSLGFLAAEQGKNVWDINFFIDGSTDLTGSGDEVKIFSTVMAMIERLVKEKDPRVLTFSAEKQSGQSRSSLYKKLVNRKASSWGYNVKVMDDKLATKFELMKK
jgi:hypothetical protein